MRNLRLVLLAALGLAGCSIHPLPEDVTGKSTYAIAQAIRCEARQALLEFAADHKYDQGAIAYDFAFTMQEDNVASIGAQFKDLYSSVSSFTLPLQAAALPLVTPTAGTTGTGGALSRQSVRRFTLVDGFAELKTARGCGTELARARPLYPITGSIGLRETIRTFMLLEGTGSLEGDADTTGPSKLPSSISSTVEFVDDLKFTTALTSGTLAPNLVLAPVVRSFRLVGLNGAFGGDRQDVHEVVVALTMPPSAAKNTTMRAAVIRSAATNTVGTPLAGQVPSKVALAVESNAKLKALEILDRRRTHGQTDDLIQAIANLRPQ